MMRRRIALIVEAILGDPAMWLTQNRLFFWAIETAYPDLPAEEAESRRVDGGRCVVESAARALRADPHQASVLLEQSMAGGAHVLRFGCAAQLAADLDAWLRVVDPDDDAAAA